MKPNTLLPVPPGRADDSRLASGDRAWIADWTDFAIVHFSLPPEVLAPAVPYPLDLFAGRAWVSLVWFDLRRLRWVGSGALGRWLCRPISDHPFLNVRTYVRPPDGPGICFLAEWISNRLSTRIGPLTYGLPYRYGRFLTQKRTMGGTATLRLEDPEHDEAFALTLPLKPPGGDTFPPGSLDAFLVERYQAYTFARGRHRFRVAHAPWRAVRAPWTRFELGFLRRVFPWFEAAEQHSAHLCGDCINVEMGRPHRVSTAAEYLDPLDLASALPGATPAHV